MTRLLGLLLSFLMFVSNTWADTFELKRADGSSITFYLDLPSGAQSFSLIALLQGSDCSSVKGQYAEFESFVRHSLKMGVLTVEKPGLPSSEPGCPREYLERNTVDQRLSDFEAVMEHIRANLPGWDHRLYLEGGSEGATVAGLLAPRVPETRAVLLLAGGGGMTMADELLLLTRKELAAQGTPEEQIEIALSRMRLKFDEIQANPTSERSWYGETNTYKWWSSILFRPLLDPLKESKVPLYFVHGTADQSVPVESTDALVAQLGKLNRGNVTYVRRDGLSHQFKDPTGKSFRNQVIASTAIWLMVLEDQELRFKIMNLLKQDPNHPDLPPLFEKMAVVDQRNTEALKQLIAQSGFPLISSHGPHANRDGWLLAQHADRDISFQREVLKILEEALAQKDTAARHVAFLTDRVMVNERSQSGQTPEQRFGTQYHLEGGCWIPWSIQDETNVDKRRIAYGLDSLSDNIRRMNEGHEECWQ